MGKKILALNIGAATVSLAEYAQSGGTLTLLNYGTAKLAAALGTGDAAAILAPALMEIVREKGIKPGKVAISIPGQMVFPRFATIAPTGSADKFEQNVRYEIEQNIPFPIDEMVCDRAILGDTAAGDKAVMIVAAKTDQMEEIARAVQGAGFTPELVDVAPLALANVLKANQAASGDDGCAVILDIGAKTTSLAIVEGEKLYNRSIPVAGNSLTKEIAQLLGCTQEEAEKLKCETAYVSMGGVTEDEDETRDMIAKACRAAMTRLHAEVSRSINFYRSQQGGGAPAKLYLTGGSSLMPGVAEFFGESLQIEVGYLDPFETMSVANSIDGEALGTDAAYIAATAGVALHAAGRAAMPIDLMPPSLIEAKAEAARVPFVAAGALAVVAAAVCWLMVASDEASRAEEAVEEVRAEADRLESIKNAGTKAIAESEAAESAAAELARKLSRKGAFAARMRAVRAAIEPNLWISKWEEKTEKRKVEKADGRRGDTEEVAVQVVRVTVRGWKDGIAKLLKSEASRGAPGAAAPDEAKAAIAAAGANAPSGIATAQTSAGDGGSRGKLTAGMIVVARLANSGEFKPETVKIIAGQPLGPDGCLEEFTVEMQPKENEWK